MRTTIVILIIALCLVSSVGGDGLITNIRLEDPAVWILSITDDGQLEINGKPVERMSDSELKTILREMVDAMKKQAENNSLIEHYNQQTEYLLEELEHCRSKKEDKP